MRAIAALMVCVWHLALQTGHLYPTSFMQSLQHLPLYTGVDLFFVISGFIMTYITRGQFGLPGSARGFAVKRLVRIVPPYWFFTSVMVFITIAVPSLTHSARFTPLHALLSYLFVPHLAPGRGQSIEPIYQLGWTLNYEMLFYAMFTLALLCKARTGFMFILTTFVLAFAASRFGLWTQALNVFFGDSILFEFLLGVAAYYVCTRFQPSILVRCLLLAGAIAWLVALSRLNVDARVIRAGIPAFFVFLALFGLPMRGRVGRGLVALGDASYSLYLSHVFVSAVCIGAAARLGTKNGSPAILSLVVFGASLLACIAASVIFYRYCERPVTDWLSRIFVGRPTKTRAATG
ncbi:MAG TPA: acyltransferase [Pirellulales bacterium]|nr:acyltransferase [Pirellulales bacterium]